MSSYTLQIVSVQAVPYIIFDQMPSCSHPQHQPHRYELQPTHVRKIYISLLSEPNEGDPTNRKPNQPTMVNPGCDSRLSLLVKKDEMFFGVLTVNGCDHYICSGAFQRYIWGERSCLLYRLFVDNTTYIPYCTCQTLWLDIFLGLSVQQSLHIKVSGQSIKKSQNTSPS